MDAAYFRPTEVELLIGDATKSRTKLNWTPEYDLARLVEDMMVSDIKVMKKTKRSEKEIDIRPFIYKMELQGDKIFMMLASASANYTKPELVTDTFFSWLGIELPEFAYSIKRLEVYADKGTEEEHKFVTLEALGEEVE